MVTSRTAHPPHSGNGPCEVRVDRAESGLPRFAAADVRLGGEPGNDRDVTVTDLEARYRAYLDALNERRLDDLVHHVEDELTYNGEPMTRRQYQDLIAADVAAIPDLVFDAHIVVASGDQVACRLVFDCTPRSDFLGFTPNGRRLVFAEHVFYRYHGGRIAEVSSLIDRFAIDAQLRPGQP